MHGIVPPYLLEAIVENGTPAQKEAARLTLEVDAQIRADRAAMAAAPAELAVPAAPRPHKNRRVHSAGNTAALPGTLIRSEGQAASGDVAVDEAYEGLGDTFDLYWDIYNRNSYDDRGGDLIATVHYRTSYNNAFWDGTRMQLAFGDGDGKTFRRFTFALDVIGHELTHGVISSGGKLPYSDQSGALNESIADVFGSLVKQRKLGQTAERADWLIGAGMFVPRPNRRASRLADRSGDVYVGVNGVALRSMSAPGTAYHDPVFIGELSPDGKDPQPDHMRGYVVTSKDYGGVHINSGIPNKAFYLAAIAIGGFAWETVGRIWYEALKRVSYNAGFQQFATLTAIVAEELEEELAAELGVDELRTKVVSAWHEVGVGGDALHLNRSAAFNAPKAVGAPSGIAFPSLDVTNIVYRDARGGSMNSGRSAATRAQATSPTSRATPRTRPMAQPRTSTRAKASRSRCTAAPTDTFTASTGQQEESDTTHSAEPPARHRPRASQPDSSRKTAPASSSTAWPTDTSTRCGGPVRTFRATRTSQEHTPSQPATQSATSTQSRGRTSSHTEEQTTTSTPSTGQPAPPATTTSQPSQAHPKQPADPIAYYTEHNDTHQVIYRGVDNHIHELYWPSPTPVQHRDLTAEANAPDAASDPAAYYVPTNNTKHVIYRSADNRIREIWWVIDATTPYEVNVTDSARAPLAADNPAAFFFPNAGTQHIAYRGADNHIHEIRWI